MQIIKYIMLFFVFTSSSLIGKYLSKKYVYRLEELEELRNSLNILKTKIKFTYEPLPEIFEEISKVSKNNVSQIFKDAKENLRNDNAGIAWKQAVEQNQNNLKDEDKEILKMMSKMLGQTDVEGQISQIEITEKFLDTKIKDAQIEKQKNEKLYTKLGTTIGLVIVLILI